jgi:hypothetical protein
MRYLWSRAGVEQAVEDVMRQRPELQQPFAVADCRDPVDCHWHVELDPLRDRKIARVSWQMIEYDQLDAIADALAEAEAQGF